MGTNQYVVSGAGILLSFTMLFGCGGSANDSPGPAASAGTVGLGQGGTTAVGGAHAAGGVPSSGAGGTDSIGNVGGRAGGSAAGGGAG